MTCLEFFLNYRSHSTPIFHPQQQKKKKKKKREKKKELFLILEYIFPTTERTKCGKPLDLLFDTTGLYIC